MTLIFHALLCFIPRYVLFHPYSRLSCPRVLIISFLIHPPFLSRSIVFHSYSRLFNCCRCVARTAWTTRMTSLTSLTPSDLSQMPWQSPINTIPLMYGLRLENHIVFQPSVPRLLFIWKGVMTFSPLLPIPVPTTTTTTITTTTITTTTTTTTMVIIQTTTTINHPLVTATTAAQEVVAWVQVVVTAVVTSPQLLSVPVALDN